MTPKISVVIPSFNAKKYIRYTLDSILNQKYPNLEIIIQDGASTDGTVEIIKSYAKKYPGIISWESKKDKGQVDAINKGLEKAVGEILAFINADDVYNKNTFKIVAKKYSQNPNALWFAGKGKIIDKDGNEKSRLVTMYKNCLLKLNKYNFLLTVNYLMQPSIFLNRKEYIKKGPFWGPKNFVMEYDLWLKIGKDKMPIIIDKYLSSFRLTKENKSSSYFKTLLPLDFQIVKKHTNNHLILGLHQLNNFGRKLFTKLT
jgi:glycosyltransferase involved in cell wall biosynthesis